MTTPSYSSGNRPPPPRRLIVAIAAGADPPLTTPSALMCHSWPDHGSCTHATPMPLATSVSHAHSKCWNASISGWVWKSVPNGGYDAASSARHEKPPAKRFDGLPSPSPCQTVPEYPSALAILDPCRLRPKEIPTSSSSWTASAGGRICSLSPPRNSPLKVLPTSW